ncbi:MAG: phosphodiester glycosidase family protein [Oscillospiraceae bacterium]
MLKRIFRRASCALLAVLVLPVSAFAALYGAGDAVYTNSSELVSGFTYTNTISYNLSGQREESFMLNLTQDSEVYPIIMACDTIYGGMTVSRIVAYAESLGYNVLAAVNTDLFSTVTKVPLGVVIEDGRFKSSPEGAPALCFAEDGTVFVSESPEVTITLTNQGAAVSADESGSGDISETAEAGDTEESTDNSKAETETSEQSEETGEAAATEDGAENAGKTVTLTHFNKARNDAGGLYLLDSSFSTVSTRTTTDGWMVRLKILDGTISVSGEMTLEVTELYEGTEAQPIGDGYLILTAGTLGGHIEEFSKFAVGDIVTLETTCGDEKLADAKWATGAADILAKNGKLTDAVNESNTLYPKNPRTALGIKDDGTIVTYVIDGRSEPYSNGLTYTQLVNELLSMGCTTVVNLDGGGSSAMSVRLPGQTTAKTVNSPSDGSERGCSTYMLYVTDSLSDGEAKSIYLENDGAFVLSGSAVELTYLATDAGYKTMTAPAGITAESSGLGTVDGDTYTAGDAAGTDTITLSTRTVFGSGSLHIITSPDAISVKNAATNETVTTLTLERGEQVQLSPSCTYLSRNVLSSDGAYTYAVSGDIGTISEEGIFTAGDFSDRAGTITVSAGTTTYTINVSIPAVLEDVEGHWSRDYVLALSDAGIVKGTTATTFEPDREIKRGDFILMLYRAAGQPVVETAATFTDVPAEAYYNAAISWAEVQGIAKGTGEGVFEPEKTLSRQQAFTFVVRALGLLGIEYTEGTAEDLAAFSDTDSIAEYAVVPTATLFNMGIVGGSDGMLSPESNLTRGQMAKVLSMVLGLC